MMFLERFIIYLLTFTNILVSNLPIKHIASKSSDRHERSLEEDRSIIVDESSAPDSDQSECVPNEQDFFKNSFFRYYNRHKLPNRRGAVEVTVEIHVQDVSTLDEMTSEFDVDVMFSEMWTDPGLKFDPAIICKSNISLDVSYFKKKFWYPNTCIVNAKQARIHQSPGDNVFAILYDTGNVWTNHRMRLRGPCDLNFVDFPLDRQSCSLVFESYSHNADEVKLQWLNSTNSTPVTLMKNITLPDFDFQTWATGASRQTYPNGDWYQLWVTFSFKRRFGFYFMQAYVPAYITIMISWISFCIDYRSMPARTTLGVSSLLAVTFQFGNIMKNLPKVSYVKALDVFMMAVTVFIFGSLLELAVVSYLATWYNREPSKSASRCRTMSKRSKRRRPPPINAYEVAGACYATMSAVDAVCDHGGLPLDHYMTNRLKRQPPPLPLETDTRKPVRPELVDKFSMFLFPVAFTVFNIGYWGYYLSYTQ